MRFPSLRAATLAAALPLAALAAVPPSQERYSVNLGIPPAVPGFVVGHMPFWIDTSDTSVNPFGLPRPVSDQSRFPVSTLPASGAPGSGAATPSYVLDANSAAFQGVVAITPGVPTAAQRSLGFVCTAAGPATLTLADGSALTLSLAASPSFQSLPFAVTNVALGSGTAGSFWGLK